MAYNHHKIDTNKILKPPWPRSLSAANFESTNRIRTHLFSRSLSFCQPVAGVLRSHHQAAGMFVIATAEVGSFSEAARQIINIMRWFGLGRT